VCRPDGTEVAPNEQLNLHFTYGNGNPELGTGFLCLNKTIISAVKRTEFVSERMLFIILRGCWYDITVLNVHTPTEDKIM
jgi:hypothetical protein